MKRTTRYPVTLIGITLGVLAAGAKAQINSNGGDGVLNAPYRGTINSLRECTMDIGYGEVRNHVEPDGTGLITSVNVEMWSEETWDRSVLRLYQELDASGA